MPSVVNTLTPYEFISKSFTAVIAIFIISYNICILIYLNNIDKPECKCVYDWRVNVIKGFAIITLIMLIISLIISILKLHVLHYEFLYAKSLYVFRTIIYIISLVNIYALFTYVEDLEDTNCLCATTDQPILYTWVNEKRYMYIILLIYSIYKTISSYMNK